MNTTVSLPVLRRMLFTGLLALNLAVNSQASGEESPGDFPPDYLAERLGLAQKATTFRGLPVREKAGRKIGKLEDAVVDLHSGRVFCALVGIGGGAKITIPGKVFYSTDEKEAVLTLDDAHPDSIPRATTTDLGALMGSLPESYKHFGEEIFWAASAQPSARKCSELLGLNVRNGAGESLGRVVNLLVDLPTARVIFVVVSLAGKGTDLYAVPPQAFQTIDQTSLLLEMDRAKISALAQSDGFFWSNLTEVGWSANVYHTFGQPADFEPAARTASVASNGNLRSPTQRIKLSLKTDRQLSEDVLAALMHDNLNNLFICKSAKIKTVHGQVTLSGFVKNEEQRSKLVSLAASVVGASNIHDELKIK